MTPDDLKWLIGSFAGMFAVAVGVVVAAFYRLSDKMQEGQDDLHHRINGVRDEYVRRTDLDAHLTRIDRTLVDMRHEMRESSKDTVKRLDDVLANVRRLSP